jgi:hypothetical protein
MSDAIGCGQTGTDARLMPLESLGAFWTGEDRPTAWRVPGAV